MHHGPLIARAVPHARARADGAPLAAARAARRPSPTQTARHAARISCGCRQGEGWGCGEAGGHGRRRGPAPGRVATHAQRPASAPAAPKAARPHGARRSHVVCLPTPAPDGGDGPHGRTGPCFGTVFRKILRTVREEGRVTNARVTCVATTFGMDGSNPGPQLGGQKGRSRAGLLTRSRREVTSPERARSRALTQPTRRRAAGSCKSMPQWRLNSMPRPRARGPGPRADARACALRALGAPHPAQPAAGLAVLVL